MSLPWQEQGFRGQGMGSGGDKFVPSFFLGLVGNVSLPLLKGLKMTECWEP